MACLGPPRLRAAVPAAPPRETPALTTCRCRRLRVRTAAANSRAWRPPCRSARSPFVWKG